MAHTGKGADQALSAAREELAWARTERGPREVQAARAERLAGHLLAASRALSRPVEEAQRAMLARLVEDPAGQAFTTALTDRVFRTRQSRLVVEQLRGLCARFGVPAYLPHFERAQLRAGAWFGPILPQAVATGVLSRVRQEARHVLLRAEEPALSAFLAERHTARVRVNVNQLGEALLGEREAEARVQKYIALAARDDVDALSVKVSSIGSQLNLVAFEQTAATLAERMARIYTATLRRGELPTCLVMLDMEAYQDVALTFEVLERALRDPALHAVRAGVVVQAYLPDAHALLREAARLSEQRRASGGQPLRVRLVKGANLAQERVDSHKSGLRLPTFATKLEVDANYKRVLEAAVELAQRGVLSVGVGSHNLFDLAYALVVREEAGARESVSIEMLEGMAPDCVRALGALDIDVLVYAPICGDDAMSSGIAYLVRRLDENTSRENFLRASFGMQLGDAAFERERQRFHEAVAHVDAIDETPMRHRPLAPAPSETTLGHRGEPDSDFSLAEIRAQLHAALAEPGPLEPPLIVSRIAGRAGESASLRDGVDPSAPSVVPYRLALASREEVLRALDCAAADPSGYARTSAAERGRLLERTAALLRARRFALVRTLVAEAGKRVVEADAEVSEAIDFAEYYRRTYAAWDARTHGALRPRGSVVVTPPWNFPLAIAAGGVLSALAAGNRVILKPALETPRMGAELAQILWEAGVPDTALQLVICEDAVGSALIEDPRVDSVILTGATDTARLFQRMRPGLRLLAETGGKNAYVVSAMSDRELSIRDAVHSAFGHAGQKCSAASLLILVAEVYDDPHFLATLSDAVRSLHVGSAWDLRSFVTPLIRPPEGALRRGLSELAPGESWLVAPSVDPQNPRLLSPGVKLGVKPGSFTHMTELFGPVLSVMRASSLDHAIVLANETGYALTAGLASLDEREQARFVERVHAGNIYINRTITGAIVQRQPFGGYQKSGFGPGAKAGGPNYVAQMCRVEPDALPRPAPGQAPPALSARLEAACALLPPEQRARLCAYVADYARAFEGHFDAAHDPEQVLGQDNRFSYRARERMALRIESDAPLFAALASLLAGELCRTPLEVSLSPGHEDAAALTRVFPRATLETFSAFAERIEALSVLRLLGTRTAEHAALSARTGAHIADEPVLGCGALELLHYLREQSVSTDYHRYGNLGARALTPT